MKVSIIIIMVIIFLNIMKFFITVLLLKLLFLLTLTCMKRVLLDPNTTFLATGFTQNSQKAQILCIPVIHDRKYMITWSGPNPHEVVGFFQISSSHEGPIIGIKFTISCEFGYTKQNFNIMFSNMKIEEYMESGRSGFFRVILVVKSTTELSLQCDVSFWRNIQMLWTRL